MMIQIIMLRIRGIRRYHSRLAGAGVAAIGAVGAVEDGAAAGMEMGTAMAAVAGMAAMHGMVAAAGMVGGTAENPIPPPWANTPSEDCFPGRWLADTVGNLNIPPAPARTWPAL